MYKHAYLLPICVWVSLYIYIYIYVLLYHVHTYYGDQVMNKWMLNFVLLEYFFMIALSVLINSKGFSAN